MAHRDLIDGTAYEIDGGKAMVGGTVYEIDHGTTLVDGTAYEVGFVEMAKVKIVASPYSSSYPIKASVQVGGEVYDLSIRVSNVAFSGVVWEGELPVGAEVILTNKAPRQVFIYTTHIDGSTTEEYMGLASYTYTVIGNAYIEVRGIYTSTGPSSYAYDIPEFYITEYEGPATVTMVRTGMVFAKYAIAINGQTYTDLTETPIKVVVEVGTVITVEVTSDMTFKGVIALNGTVVKRTDSGKISYSHIVKGNVTIEARDGMDYSQSKTIIDIIEQ